MGVWNGWWYGISVLQALNFQCLEPEHFGASLFCSAEFQRVSCIGTVTTVTTMRRDKMKKNPVERPEITDFCPFSWSNAS